MVVVLDEVVAAGTVELVVVVGSETAGALVVVGLSTVASWVEGLPPSPRQSITAAVTTSTATTALALSSHGRSRFWVFSGSLMLVRVGSWVPGELVRGCRVDRRRMRRGVGPRWLATVGSMGRFSRAPVDRAAGGVVFDRREGRPVVAVVHRPRYDDWALPKGHVDSGESWEEAALREVAEETGIRARIEGPPRPIAYMLDEDTVKLVVVFPMSVVENLRTPPDPNEVDEVRWLDPATARSQLSYPVEIGLVEGFLGAGFPLV